MKYRATAKYKRVNPKTKVVEPASRWLEMPEDEGLTARRNKEMIKTLLLMQVGHDEVVSRVVFDVKKVR